MGALAGRRRALARGRPALLRLRPEARPAGGWISVAWVLQTQVGLWGTRPQLGNRLQVRGSEVERRRPLQRRPESLCLRLRRRGPGSMPKMQSGRHERCWPSGMSCLGREAAARPRQVGKRQGRRLSRAQRNGGVPRRLWIQADAWPGLGLTDAEGSARRPRCKEASSARVMRRRRSERIDASTGRSRWRSC